MAVGKDRWNVGFVEASQNAGRDLLGVEGGIGAGCRVRGTVELHGRAQIDGFVEGEVSATGSLTIGESGIVKANITGAQVLVFGRVEGDIVCSERLELHTGAWVRGDITSPTLVVQDGVVFEGNCRMRDPEELEAKPTVELRNEDVARGPDQGEDGV